MSSEVSKLSPSLLNTEQQAAIEALYEGNVLLYAGLGFGKTIVAATAIAELIGDGHLKRVLIVTTPKIAKTVWAQEFDKWAHTQHITVALATGTPNERYRVINGDAQVVVITFNTLADFCKTHKKHNFDGLLIDESTKLKSPGGVGFKSLKRKLKDFTWRAALTGTPTSENFLSLYAQMYLIDDGAALGKNYQKFKEKFFYPTDYNQYNWELRDGADKEIVNLVAHLIHAAPDYTHTLPEITYERVLLTAPDDVMVFYAQMKRDMVVDDVVAVNTAALSQKLQQIASGWAYDEYGDARHIHDFREHALADLVAQQDTPVVVFYWFQEDLARIRSAIPHAVEMNPQRPSEAVEAWNAGEIDVLLLHPRSAGHGLNLAGGGHTIVWHTPQWSRDLWKQANARLWRRGQQHPVTVYTLVVENTVDEAVVERVGDKALFEFLLLKHLNN